MKMEILLAAIKLLGGVVKDQVEFKLPESDIYRNLFIIFKEKTRINLSFRRVFHELNY